MSSLRFLTAGESHGRSLIGIIEGIPAGLTLIENDIDKDLRRRQGGYGRGGRMKIESDHAEMLSGVRWGRTIGSPIALVMENKDFENWREGMSPYSENEGSVAPVLKPRPGHADLSGAIKYNHLDIRNVLERSSARETAMRVGLGAIARKFLSEFNIIVGSYVIQIGMVKISGAKAGVQGSKEKLLSLFRKAENSPVRCPDEEASKKMVRLVDRATKEGNSLGGVFEVFATGAPVGLGSHIQWDKRLGGRLARALMSIQAIKGVEIGLGFGMSGSSGSEVMDEIFYDPRPPVARGGSGRSNISGGVAAGFYRKTNNAGGIEGGMTNGMPVVLRAAMKPIPTLRRPLRSVNVTTKKAVEAAYERSDICAVPAAGVIGEAMVALTVADVFLQKFGGDSMKEVKRNYNSYMQHVVHF